jgi:hypothetical protein
MTQSNLPHPAFGGTVSALVTNDLFMPGKDPRYMPMKIAIGQTIERGAVLGLITATGLVKVSEAAATDGSEVPRFVAPDDINTTADTVPPTISVFVEGAFNETALVYGTGHTADTVRIPLMERGIYLNAPRYSYA